MSRLRRLGMRTGIRPTGRERTAVLEQARYMVGIVSLDDSRFLVAEQNGVVL